MKVNIKRLHEGAVIPKYAMPFDAGMDITAISKQFDRESGCIIYGTGIAVEIPEGHVGLLFPRSSIYKRYMEMTNCVGVIDAGYRGEVKVIMRNSIRIVRPKRFWDRIRAIFCRMMFKCPNDVTNSVIMDNIGKEDYSVGERIAQLIIMPFPKVEFNEVDSLSESERGEGGHGSTGE